MAAPRKRTARKTTSSRSRAPVNSGRSSSSFIAMGMIAGLAVAILFYAIFIRQDASLSKGTTANYAHTPNQPHLLNPLPPKPSETQSTKAAISPAETQTGIAEAGASSDSKPSPAPVLEPKPSTEPRMTKAPTKPAAEQTPSSVITTKPLAEQAPATPAPGKAAPERSTAATTTPKATSKVAGETKQPQPRITEDPIGSLIAQNERPQKVAPAGAPKTAPAKAKEEADHLGALLKTIPTERSTSNITAGSPATTAANTTAKAATNAKPTASPPESKLSLSPAPTEQRPFYLQTAPYQSENDADAVRAQLLLLGHSSAAVHKALVNNKTVYRVRIGPYTTSNALNQTRKSLEAAKLKLHPVQ